MPMGRIKIFDPFELKPGGVDFAFDAGDFFVSPKRVGVPGQPPAAVVADGLVAGLIAPGRAEIIHEVNDDVSASALASEAVMLLVKLVPI